MMATFSELRGGRGGGHSFKTLKLIFGIPEWFKSTLFKKWFGLFPDKVRILTQKE